jgi:hypothetical protein
MSAGSNPAESAFFCGEAEVGKWSVRAFSHFVASDHETLRDTALLFQTRKAGNFGWP